MRSRRLVLWIGLLTLILSACTASASTLAPSVEPSAAAPTETPAPPPAPLPAPTEPRPDVETPPAGAKAEFEKTDFTRHGVSYDEIVSGGPPKDGIPAIDTPRFIAVEEADEWLDPREPVVLVHVGDVARAYPVQILMWHEIVNDTIGDLPVAVTYCPLCNTGAAFERTFDGRELTFGTSGRLRFGNLIMYDRQTQTWWQQATGEGIVGEYTGRQLAFVPAAMISWADFRASHPQGEVLSRETGYPRDYGVNPYRGYDGLDQAPFPGVQPPDVLSAKARVLAVELNDEAVAYPFSALREAHAVNDVVGGVPVVVLWEPGTASVLDAHTVRDGEDVGAATIFARALDGQTLTFAFDGERVVDEQTGSEWDVLGRAVRGALAGRQLEAIAGVNHFWFSWSAFRPQARVYGVEAMPNVPEPVLQDRVELEADFEIAVYQGADALGGKRVMFSDVVAQGKPVVLNFWAGVCPLCRAEMPHLQKAYETYGDRVLIVAVDIGPYVRLGDEDDARALLDDLEITFPAGSTPDGSVVRAYNVLGTPSNLFFAPTGEIVERFNGVLNENQLNTRIEALIAASEAS